MRPWFCLLLLTACTAERAPPAPLSPCREEQFEGSAFVRCAQGSGAIEIRSGHRNFADLGLDPGQVAFAMNAGMFDDAGKPIGLMIERGREVHALNTRDGGGNFHLKPNGVFLVRRDGSAAVVASDAYKSAADIAFATQSGPILLIDGKPNAKFDSDGQSRYVRNGVGVDARGAAHFVISLDVVSFGKFARYFRDRIGARDALYFDGSVSSLWDPANARQDNFTDLGPMVVVFRAQRGSSISRLPAESAPGHAGRAIP